MFICCVTHLGLQGVSEKRQPPLCGADRLSWLCRIGHHRRRVLHPHRAHALAYKLMLPGLPAGSRCAGEATAQLVRRGCHAQHCRTDGDSLVDTLGRSSQLLHFVTVSMPPIRDGR